MYGKRRGRYIVSTPGPELSLKNAFVPKILNEKTIFLNLTNIKILLILSMELFKVSFNNK